MKLKKLTILGFKSFAEKISLDFDCDIIAIVGPNGCGKSNIVDAFRWVLGEQSAKSMRADKMQDVLFAGNDKRKPVNYAEVTVELSDVPKEVSPYHEVTITRRLYITGESEYLINRQPARLKDIQDLFMGSGLGKHAFSVFEQGKLDQVINLRPEERRLIFDEAAGIGRFLTRKKETLSKLSQVNENYNRIKDVHSEIEKETKTLKKQAERAIGFQENKEKLALLEKRLLLNRWKKAFESEKAMADKLDRFQKEAKVKKEELLSLEKEVERNKKLYVSEEKRFQANQRELFDKKTELELLKREKEEIKNALSECDKSQFAFSEEIQNLKSSRKDEGKKVEKERKALLDLEGEKNRLFDLLEEEKAKKDRVEKELDACRQKIRECQKKELQTLKEEKAVDFQIQENLLKVAAKAERLQGSLRQLKEKGIKISDLGKEILLIKEKTAALISEIDELKKSSKDSENSLKDHYGKIERKKEERAKLSQKVAENRARKEILLKLKEQYEGFSSGAKKLILEAKNPKSVFYKKIEPLFEALLAKKGYEKALGAALRVYSDTLVVKDQKTAKEVLAFAKKNQITHFALLSLDVLKEEKGVKNSLAKYVEENSLSKHFLKNIQFVEELEDLQPNLATKEGDFIDHNLVIFKRKGEDLFQRESEIKEILLIEEKLNQELTQLEEELHALLNEAKEKEALRKEALEAHRKKEILLFRENFSLQKVGQSLEEEKKERLILEKEMANLKESEEDQSHQHTLAEKKENCQKTLSFISKEIQKEEKVLQEIEKEAFTKKLEESQKLYNATFQKWQALDHEMRVALAKDQQNEKAIQKYEKELLALSQKKEKLHHSLQEREGNFEGKEREWETLSQSFAALEERLKSFLSEREEQEKKWREESQHFGFLEKEQVKLEWQEGEIKAKKKSFEESLVSQFQVSDEEKSRFLEEPEENLAGLEERALKLRYELEKEDRINFAAIEEYKEKEARFQFYEKQLSDLDESRKDLEKIITKLEGDSRKLFKKTFQEIRSNFQKNFSILFKGGEADLKFTETSDVLEAGIEILAKPPGKNMRAISLLSGGEKCLTALSLLFAIFETRPAPFCILDEVDAPLDDTNVDLFSEMLKQFTKKTQFIIVTHNKKTMAFADILLGVSMEEKGVSKLISLSFEKKRPSPILESVL